MDYTKSNMEGMTPEQINTFLELQREQNEQYKVNHEILMAKYATLDANGQPTIYGRSWGYQIFMKLVEALPCWMPYAIQQGTIPFPFEMGVPDANLMRTLEEDCQEWININCPGQDLEVKMASPEFIQHEVSPLYKQVQPYRLSVAIREKEQEGKTR